MNIEFLKELGLSDEIISSVMPQIQTALDAEYERGLSDGTAQMEELKMAQAVDAALSATGAKNPQLLKKLIDISALSLEDGEIVGLDEQIEEIRQENPFLFEEENPAPKFTLRTKSSDKITKQSFDKMSYMDRVKLYSKNPALYNKLKG